MNVRGWLIVGPDIASVALPPEMQFGPPGALCGDVPNASAAEPGQWVRWSPTYVAPPMTLVCVEIPLG